MQGGDGGQQRIEDEIAGCHRQPQPDRDADRGDDIGDEMAAIGNQRRRTQALAQAQQNMYSAVAGMNAAANVNMTGTGGAGGVNETNITIASGAIVVNALPGMDEEMVAQKVIDKVGSVLEISRSKGLR